MSTEKEIIPQMSLETTIEDCWEIAESHGFHNLNRTFGDVCALIHSEVSEAFERYRVEGSTFGYWYEVDGKPEGVVSELADIVIRCFDAAINEVRVTPHQFAIIIHQKMEYNRRRPMLHNKII